MALESREELLSRLDLMEEMVQQGRKATQHWGWMFLLWGVGYLVAIGWVYYLPKPMLAWPVTMPLTAIAGAALARMRSRSGPSSTLKSRAIGGIWCATGCSIFIFAFGSAFGAHAWDAPGVMLAGIEILVGLAHAASSITLRWRPQLFVAIVWWACGVASFYVSGSLLLPILLVATLIGNIGFGFYLMALESRRNKGLAHA